MRKRKHSAARVEVTADEDAPFRDPQTGRVNEYAKRMARRVAAATMYLDHWRSAGHHAAAAAVCDRYGHERHGARCARCGAPLLGPS